MAGQRGGEHLSEDDLEVVDVLINVRRWRAASGRYDHADGSPGRIWAETAALAGAGGWLLHEPEGQGARRTLATALQAEVAAYVDACADQRDA